MVASFEFILAFHHSSAHSRAGAEERKVRTHLKQSGCVWLPSTDMFALKARWSGEGVKGIAEEVRIRMKQRPSNNNRLPNFHRIAF